MGREKIKPSSVLVGILGRWLKQARSRNGRQPVILPA